MELEDTRVKLQPRPAVFTHEFPLDLKGKQKLSEMTIPRLHKVSDGLESRPISLSSESVVRDGAHPVDITGSWRDGVSLRVVKYCSPEGSDFRTDGCTFNRGRSGRLERARYLEHGRQGKECTLTSHGSRGRRVKIWKKRPMASRLEKDRSRGMSEVISSEVDVAAIQVVQIAMPQSLISQDQLVGAD